MTTTTTSFLMDCPQCGVMIPKGGPCPDCRWVEGADAGAYDAAQYPEQDLVQAFAARSKVHFRNYTIFMLLAFATAIVGMITAGMWFKLIYLGDVVAFFLIGFLTVFTAILGGVSACAKKLFPVDLNCPACGIRVDELGTNGGYCPNCDVRLK